MWDWTTRTYVQAIDVGEDAAPLEIRFLHNPDAAEGFVGCTISSSIHRFYKTEARALPGTGGRGVCSRAVLPAQPPGPCRGGRGSRRREVARGDLTRDVSRPAAAEAERV